MSTGYQVKAYDSEGKQLEEVHFTGFYGDPENKCATNLTPLQMAANALSWMQAKFGECQIVITPTSWAAPSGPCGESSR